MTLCNDPCRYLVFEGPDGSGKSTLAHAVQRALCDALHGPGTILSIAFPTATSAPGQLIRRVFNGQETVSPRSVGLLMLADALEAEPTLTTHYVNGGYIIADRHTLVSGWVYQSDVFDLDYILAYQRRAQFLYPDRVFILDVPADVAEARITARAAARNAMYEPKDRAYQERLREKYLAYAIMNRHHTSVLDGTRPVDELVAQVITLINAPSIMRADGSLRSIDDVQKVWVP